MRTKEDIERVIKKIEGIYSISYDNPVAQSRYLSEIELLKWVLGQENRLFDRRKNEN